MDDFKVAGNIQIQNQVEKLVPRRFAEFVCFLAQHRNSYTRDTQYKPYDDLCRKHHGTRYISNYILASAHNESKPSAKQVKHLFNIPEATTYKITKALREIEYIDENWMPLKPLVELNTKRTLAFFDSPVFYFFIMACITYYIVRRGRQIEKVFSIGYWLNLFEKDLPQHNPVDDWNFHNPYDSHGESPES
jgi:hypothetical protein